MKKLLSLFLILGMILSLAACSSKEPTTEAQKDTTAPTEAPTTKAPLTDKNATAEDIFAAMKDHLVNWADSAQGKSKESVTASFDAAYDVNLKLVMSGTTSDPIELIIGGTATGQIDSAEGLHVVSVTRSNLGGLLMALLGGEEEGLEETRSESYIDLKGGRIFTNNENPPAWYYTDFETEETEEDIPWDNFTLDKLFESYTFTVEDECYKYQGKLNVNAVSESGEEISEMVSGFPVKDLVLNSTLVVNPEKKLSEITIKGEPITMDISELVGIGMNATLDELALTAKIVYEAYSFDIPADVKENAVEVSDPGLEIGSDAPWSHDKFVIDNEVLIDNEHLTLTLVSMKSEFLGIQLFFEALNKGSKDISLDINALAVDSYNCSVFAYERIPAGESKQFYCTIYDTELEYAGVKHIDEITMLISVEEKDSWEELVSESVTVYPTGLTAGSVTYPALRTSDSALMVVDNEVLKLVMLECEKDSYGTTFYYYIENRSDVEIEVSFEDILFNGMEFQNDSWLFETTVAPGFRGYFSEIVSADKLQTTGVTDVEKMEFSLKVEDYATWEDAELHTQDVVWEP